MALNVKHGVWHAGAGALGECRVTQCAPPGRLLAAQPSAASETPCARIVRQRSTRRNTTL